MKCAWIMLWFSNGEFVNQLIPDHTCWACVILSDDTALHALSSDLESTISCLPSCRGCMPVCRLPRCSCAVVLNIYSARAMSRYCAQFASCPLLQTASSKPGDFAQQCRRPQAPPLPRHRMQYPRRRLEAGLPRRLGRCAHAWAP